MSSTVFAELTRSDPELQAAAAVIDDWMDSLSESQRKKLFTSRIARELSDKVSVNDLAKIVGRVQNSSRHQIVYRVEDPEGNLLSKAYERMSDIPDEMVDLSGNSFEVGLSNVQQVIIFHE